MSLILVILADSTEAAQLATLIQGRLEVDLVQAAEVGEGLLALDDRIPDLILTSPLMSPFDDGVLDEYLRELGPAGAHVQTLRIPVLSQAPKKTKRIGFSLRRRSKPEPAIDGCDPKFFADEIEQYLARAAEEKRHAASNDQSAVNAREDLSEIAEPVIAEEQWTAAYSEGEPAADVPWRAPEPQAEAEPALEVEPEPEPMAWRADLLDRPAVDETPIYQPSPVAYEESPVEVEAAVASEPWTPPAVEAIAEPEIEEVIEPPRIEEAIEVATVEAISAIEPIVEPAPAIEPSPVIATAAAIEESPIEESPIEDPQIEEARIDEPKTEEVPVSVAAHTPAAPELDENKATPSFKAALAAIRAAWGKAPRTNGSSIGTPEPPAPVEAEPVAAVPEAPAAFEVDLTDVVEVLDEEPADLDVRAAALTQVEPAVEAVEVYELSVEPDLSELESQLVTPPPPQKKTSAPAPPAPPVEEQNAVESAPAAEVNGDRSKKGKRSAKGAKAKPARQEQAQQPQSAQNEWGIFDPSQCGFAALVDKLDEVADKKAKQPQNGAKARVISLS